MKGRWTSYLDLVPWGEHRNLIFLARDIKFTQEETSKKEEKKKKSKVRNVLLNKKKANSKLQNIPK